MRKFMIIGFSLFLLMAGFTTYSVAQNQPGKMCPKAKPGYAGYDKDAMSKVLKLTDKQKEEMRGIWEGLAKEKNIQRAEMQNARIDCKSALTGNNPDFSKARSVSKKVSSLKNDMHESYIKALEATYDLLDEKQKKNWAEAMKNVPDGMGGKMCDLHGMGMGQGQGRGYMHNGQGPYGKGMGVPAAD